MMEPHSLGQLVERHAAALVLYARQWCRAPEDVVQDAFVKLAGLRSPPRQVVAWLYRVVRNGALDAGRAQRRREKHESEAAGRQPAWFVPAEGAVLDAQVATRALEALPLELREPVLAHLWGGLTFSEIAGLMSCSPATAHRRYLEGLAALRERLRVPCPDHPPTRPTGRS